MLERCSVRLPAPYKKIVHKASSSKNFEDHVVEFEFALCAKLADDEASYAGLTIYTRLTIYTFIILQKILY